MGYLSRLGDEGRKLSMTKSLRYSLRNSSILLLSTTPTRIAPKTIIEFNFSSLVTANKVTNDNHSDLPTIMTWLQVWSSAIRAVQLSLPLKVPKGHPVLIASSSSSRSSGVPLQLDRSSSGFTVGDKQHFLYQTHRMLVGLLAPRPTTICPRMSTN